MLFLVNYVVKLLRVFPKILYVLGILSCKICIFNSFNRLIEEYFLVFIYLYL